MSSNNVFMGPSALNDYYNPDKSPPLPLVELPPSLNPFHDSGIRIFAKMMTFLPAHNVKALTAFNLLSSPQIDPAKTKAIVEYSSGSTVISMSIAARILHGITDTRAYLSNKTSASKLRLLQFFGLRLRLFAGPDQPEPCDRRGGIMRAREDSEADEGLENCDQYENERNWGAHVRWTGPQILRQLPSISVMCAGMGTAGTLTGIATYLKREKPSVTTVAVCVRTGDRVPGPRSYTLIAPLKFPWRSCVDAVVESGNREAYTLSLQLSRHGLVCGPSSGVNLDGLLQYLRQREEQKTLHELKDENGLIDCVFICCDLPYQYIDDYPKYVAASEFHPIQGADLATVDTHRYDVAWEFDPLSEKLDALCQRDDAVLLDLRSAEDGYQLPHSKRMTTIKTPLTTLKPDQASPYFDSSLLKQQWKELVQLFGTKSNPAAKHSKDLEGKVAMIVCHGGDTARMTSAILRANGIEAYSIKGGAKAWAARLVNSPTGEESAGMLQQNGQRREACEKGERRSKPTS